MTKPLVREFSACDYCGASHEVIKYEEVFPCPGCGEPAVVVTEISCIRNIKGDAFTCRNRKVE